MLQIFFCRVNSPEVSYVFLRNEPRSQADFFSVPNVSFVWTSLFQINRRKRIFLALNIVTVIKLTISISNFQIIYTFGVKKISKINISSYKLRPWFTKGDAPPSKTCKFDLINGEAHSNVSDFSDRTLAECYKSILPNFQNDTEPTVWGTIFHQADLSGGVRRMDLGKSNYNPILCHRFRIMWSIKLVQLEGVASQLYT